MISNCVFYKALYNKGILICLLLIMIIEYIIFIQERWWFTGNIYVLPIIRYDSTFNHTLSDWVWEGVWRVDNPEG